MTIYKMTATLTVAEIAEYAERTFQMKMFRKKSSYQSELLYKQRTRGRKNQTQDRVGEKI
jgi:hypothetical protein